MIKHLALAAVAVGLMASPSTASVVIDDFLTDTEVGGVSGLLTDGGVGIVNGITRTIEVDSVASAVEVSGGALDVAVAQTESARIIYDLTAATINRGFFVDRILTLEIPSITSFGDAGTLDISVAVASLGATTGSGTLTVTSLAGLNLVDVISNGNGHLAALADVDTLTITVANNDTGGVSDIAAFTSTTQITAVPEPTSIALLGLTGIGGVIAVRRRRKSVSNS